MSDRPLTPEEQRTLVDRLEYLDGLMRGTPVAVQNDVLVKIWGQLIRTADTQDKLMGLLEELVEIQRGRLELTRGYMQADDEEARP